MDISQVVVRIRGLRVEPQRLPMTFRGLQQVPLNSKGAAQVIVGGGETGIEIDRLTIGSDRRRRLLLAHEHDAEVKMTDGIGGV